MPQHFIPLSIIPKLAANSDDETIMRTITRQVYYGNRDNISRTMYYQSFYLYHKEIRWSFLAAMVSRNAGWNMCDLYSPSFMNFMKPSNRKKIFLTYERANWLIFQDAYPQLLLYHYSTILKRNLFHLLEKFHVSQFMTEEWERFFIERDEQRLMTALIINEQNIIQKPVIKHPLYKRTVFMSPLFLIQEHLHFSSVIFPTIKGELYGATVVHFRSLNKRIEFGKKLSHILFHPDLYPSFFQFAKKTEHTGSRYDYEQYLNIGKNRDTPYLRTSIPIIEHHISKMKDWSKEKTVNEKWFIPNDNIKPTAMTNWFLKKRKQIQLYGELINWIMSKRRIKRDG